METAAPKEGWEKDEVFWSIYRQVLGLEKPLLDIGRLLLDELPLKLEEKERFASLLEDAELKELREQAQLTSEPYEEDGAPDHGKLRDHLHPVAALALRLRARDGYNDDVRDWLREAWRTAYRFFDGERCGYRLDDWKLEGSTYPFDHSCAAITAIVLLELFRVDAIDGKYPEALHKLALALWWTGNVFQAVPEEQDEFYVGLGSGTELLRKHLSYVPAIDLEAQEAVEVFESLLRVSGAQVDWQQVAKDCQNIADYWAFCLRDDKELVKDTLGREWEWRVYWSQASGWARAKLEPSEARDELRRREQELVDNILSTYFFQHSLSSCLPERARERLIVAADQWLRGDRGVASIIPNELKIAVEELLYHTVWAPLDRWANPANGPLSADFIELRNRLQRQCKQPDLSHFKEALDTRDCKVFLETVTVYQTERDFLLKELPGVLDELRRVRRRAEHYYGKTLRRDEVRALFNKLLGVNQSGVLPRLSRLYVKVMESQAKRQRA